MAREGSSVAVMDCDGVIVGYGVVTDIDHQTADVTLDDGTVWSGNSRMLLDLDAE